MPCRRTTAVLVFLTAAALVACTAEKAPLKAGFEAGRYRTIIAFGDSIVEGYGQPQGWPEILDRDLAARYPGSRVINAGVSGDTAADGLARLKTDVLDRSPDMVLISFGLNDMKNRVGPDSFRRDLESLVDAVGAAGAQPVLLTTTRLQRGATMVARVTPEPFNAIIFQTARSRKVPLIDVYQEFYGYNSARYLMDVAHPNAEGYQVLAGIIRQGLLGD